MLKQKEIYSGDTEIDQKDALSDDDLNDYQAAPIAVVSEINQDHMDLLAFNEEPITIRLEASSDKHAPMWVFIAVNGKGAEVRMPDGKWIEYKYLPVNYVLTTKRKYVEVLARAKRDTIQTNVVEENNRDPENQLLRVTSSAAAFSVIHDPNPKGVTWLTDILRRAA